MVSTWSARAVALAVLAATAYLSRNATRVVDVRAIDPDPRFAQVGVWQRTEIAPPSAESDGAVVNRSYVFRDPKGREVAANLVLTATRLGALRISTR